MTLEIRNQKLVIDDNVIGDEDYLFSIFEKAVKYDEIREERSNFEEGDS